MIRFGRQALAGAGIVCLLVAAPALAQRAISHSPWNATEVLADAFPDAAWKANVSGTAQVQCTIRLKALERCALVSEAPAGMGFGPALVRIALAITLSDYGSSLEGLSVVTAPGGRALVTYAFKPPANANSSGLATIGAISRHLPERAARGEITGAATVRCVAADTGRLGACALVSETPEGVGFGPAALASAHHFRVAPALVAEMTGKAVTLPMNFRVGG